MNVVELDELDSMIMTMSSEEEEEEIVFHLLCHSVVVVAVAVDEMNVCLSIEFVEMHDASYEDVNEMMLEMEHLVRSYRNRSLSVVLDKLEELLEN